jgi:hypothetical protein
MKLCFLLLEILFCVLARLVRGMVMDWPTDAITATRVGLFVFAATNAFMGLLTRYL